MIERTIKSYGELDSVLEELCIVPRTNKVWHQDMGAFLFRGQSKADDEIRSSLERSDIQEISFYDYYWKMIYPVHPKIQSLSAHRFELESVEELREWSRSFYNKDSPSHKLLAYELLAFMRHHGYPSPLIDWSRSPYIALYFACSQNLNTDGALWSYEEFGIHGQTERYNKPTIQRPGHYIATHERHHRQQGEYLYSCTFKSSGSDGEWIFIPFQNFYSARSSNPIQDSHGLKKIIIKSEAKVPILKRLDAMNINAYSLYNSIDAMMETERLRRL